MRPESYDKKVGLVMQGGGALGSYQAGVYEALAASEYMLDWVAGISIGAINAAIIAFLKYLFRIDAIAVNYLVNLNTLVPRNVLLVDAANSGLQCQRRLKS